MFSLVAPTIDEVKLVLDDNEHEMKRLPDGRFEYTPATVSDGDHSYKFWIKKQGWILSSTVDVLDPYVKRYDPDEKLGYITVKNGRIYQDEFQWQHDDVQLPDNNQLILYELYVADFADNGQFSGVMDKLDYLEHLGINAIELMPIFGRCDPLEYKKQRISFVFRISRERAWLGLSTSAFLQLKIDVRISQGSKVLGRRVPSTEDARLNWLYFQSCRWTVSTCHDWQRVLGQGCLWNKKDGESLILLFFLYFSSTKGNTIPKVSHWQDHRWTIVGWLF